MRLGAFDHLTKPIGRDDLALLLARVISTRKILPSVSSQPKASADALVGSSEAMRRVQKMIGLAADTDTTVLILGETGRTGKEVVARALHEHSRRKGKPFIAVNCAAIPAELLESELFGHVRGAFTGATFDRPGAFREADGGTILLDEIGDMSAVMQAKILRALQERIVTPLGGKAVECGCARPCRHPSRLAVFGLRKRIPGGPLLSPECCDDQASAVARTGSRYHALGRAFPPTVGWPARTKAAECRGSCATTSSRLARQCARAQECY